MAASPRALHTDQPHAKVLEGIEKGLSDILSSLEDDPYLQRNGFSRSSDFVGNLADSLENLRQVVQRDASHVLVHEQQVVGRGAAHEVMTGAPALCSQLLRLAALAVRWPAREAWLQCEHLSPEAATSTPGRASKRPAPNSSHRARARTQLCDALSSLGGLSHRLLSTLLASGPLDPACRLACTLLRMHTMEACSRSLARAVDRLVAVCPADDTVGTVGDASAAREGSAPHTAASRVQGPYMDLVFAVDCARAALQGCAMLVTRLRQAELIGVGLGTAAGADGDRHRASEASAAGPGASSSATGGSGSGRTGGGDGSSSCSGGGGGGDGAGSGPTRPHPDHDAQPALLHGALLGSGLVEHLARGVLHLLRIHQQQGTELGAVVHAPVGFLAAYVQLSTYMGTIPRLAGKCDGILGSPCASYLATAAGLHVLCTADAGPTYGMRPLLAGADVSLWCATGLRGAADVAWPRGCAQPGGLEVANATFNLVPLSALAYGVMHRPPKCGAGRAVSAGELRCGLRAAVRCGTWRSWAQRQWRR